MKPNSKGQTISASLGLLFALILISAGAQPARAQWSPIANPTPTPGTNIYYNSGNVGIGTTSPSALLHADFVVSGGSNKAEVARFTANDSGGSRGILIYGTGAGGSAVVGFGKNTSVDYGFFAVDGTTRLVTIQDGGNVGIGTTAPLTPLHVVGQAGVTSFTGTTRLGVTVTGGTSTTEYSGIDFTTLTNTVVSRIASLRGASGSYLQFGTSNSYGSGITNTAMTIDPSGYVGIGKNPTVELDVLGSINLTGTINAKYQDVAEWVPSSEQLSAGTVVVLDSTKSNHVVSSSQPYDTRVAGVISEQPGIALGEQSDGKVLVATTGRVKVKVDASRGPIHIGDLLVTSDIPGVATKSEAVNLGGVQIHRPGTLIGKALEPLEKGKGEILVLLSLQ